MAENFKNSVLHLTQNSWAYLQQLPASVWQAALFWAALLWLSHSLANLVWLLAPSPELKAPEKWAESRVTGAALSNASGVDVDGLLAIPLFGTATGDVDVVEEENVPAIDPRDEIERNAAKTTLDLKLVGVLVSSNPELSSATIARGSEQELYEIDQKLPVGTNVTLAKVLSDRVILNNGGRYESLWLYPEAEFNRASGPAYSYSRPPEIAQDEVPYEEQSELRTEAVIRPSEIPNSISDVVRFSVHREEGQMVGFRIRPGKNRELFDRLGLQTNDVVTSVNGVPIDTAQAIRDNYQELKNATTADLEVKRGQETVYVHVSIDTSE